MNCIYFINTIHLIYMLKGRHLRTFFSRTLTTIFVVGFLFTSTGNISAAVPRLLSFQGRLSNSSGDLLGSSGTNYYFKFSIYNSSASGSQLWTSGSSGIAIKVTQGVFNTLLGDTSAGFNSLDLDFDSTSNYYLEVQVSSDNASFETLTPRQRIVSAGFAVNADSVHGGRFINASGVGQFGTLATVSYSRFGAAVTSHGLSAPADLLTSGILESFGQAFFDADASVAGNFELTGSNSKLGINAGGLIDSNLEVGGTASISGTLSLGGNINSSGLLISGGTGSSSFAGSLTISKGITANSYQGGGLGTCVSSNQKLLYSNGQFSCGTDQTGVGGTSISLAPASADSDSSSNPSIFVNDTAGGKFINFQESGATKFYVDNTGDLVSSGALNFGKGSVPAVSYSRLGSSTTSRGLSSASDLLISGNTEIGNQLFVNGAVTLSNSINSSFTGSNSFAGSLNVSKGLVANTLTVNTLNYTNLTASVSGAFEVGAYASVSGGAYLAINGGNVGVGTVSPTTKFQVQGNASISLNFEIGGIASIGGNAGFYGVGSSSFAGSLAVSKGLTANSYQGGGLANCGDSSHALSYSGGQFGCQNISGTGGSSFFGLLMGEGSSTATHATQLTFSPSGFDLSSAASSSFLSIDYLNGPASRSIAQTISGLWTFSGGATFSAPFELSSTASIGGNATIKGTLGLTG
ncbi:MAG: hypothetical protein KBC81_02870, partial [Candidatus Pacebacteria bacterium]|nr:hypothetical protein [Candidatus Paceibacterota bacterium]